MSALVLAFLIVSKFGGEEILSGLASTTLFRVITSDTTTSTMLGRITIWGGGVYALAFIRLALYVRQDLATGLLLFASSLLVPIYHVGRGEMVSQHKHMAFALFFAAPLAGCASNYWATVGMATVCRGRPYAAEREQHYCSNRSSRCRIATFGRPYTFMLYFTTASHLWHSFCSHFLPV